MVMDGLLRMVGGVADEARRVHTPLCIVDAERWGIPQCYSSSRRKNASTVA